MSYQLNSWLGSAKSEQTDKITPPPGTKGMATAARSRSRLPRAAATEVLGRGVKNASAPWENPSPARAAP